MQDITQKDVFDFLSSQKKPLTFEAILKGLRLKQSHRRTLKRHLKNLINENLVFLLNNNLYSTKTQAKSSPKLLRGIFQGTSSGYGFVLPEELNTDDIFIPRRYTAGAMDADRVQVELINTQTSEGRIVKILSRANKYLRGSIFSSGYKNKIFYFIPSNKRIPYEFLVMPKDLNSAKVGDKVLAEVVLYPQERKPSAVKVLKLLKSPQSITEDIEGIIDEYALAREFAPEVSKYAKTLKSPYTDSDLHSRIDLRDIFTVTIDGETAKDFDDAVSISKSGTDYILYVHIADVSHFVPESSCIDLEAKRRGNSYYFPDRVIPMLPKQLSENICSLMPQQDRLTFTVKMRFDQNGTLINAEFFKSLIHSNHRLTYSTVKEILIDCAPQRRQEFNHCLRDLELMQELAELLKQNKANRGCLDFDLPEPEVILDLQGLPENIVKAERNFAHMIIEEFMISANEAVANFIASKGLPMLYRVHEAPEISKLNDVVQFVKLLGIYKGKKLPTNLRQIIDDVANTQYADVVNFLILRSLKQARYHHSNVGHYGLASECYCHFTSPIRRYPDLVVHRILSDIITNSLTASKIKTLEASLPEIVSHCSSTERLANEVEATTLLAYRCWFMKDKIGEEFKAKVMSLSHHGMKVRLDDYFVEGFVHVSTIKDDYYIFDEQTMTLRGKRTKRTFKIADTVTVRLDRVSIDDREIYFGLV